jgi:predicted molibdopterin-dependent oxidoreductase YjgC
MSGIRIKHHHRGKRVMLTVNGRPVAAYSGETLFAVLCAEGIIALRPVSRKSAAAARGGFCGMGVCQECRVMVDGLPDQRACMTEVRDGMEILTDGR